MVVEPNYSAINIISERATMIIDFDNDINERVNQVNFSN